MSLDGSARSALLTVLGDVVRPTGGRAWLGALSELMEALGTPPTTTRQALRRLDAQGMVTTERHGRRAAYVVTAAGRRRLDEAAERIYAREAPAWDGRWRLLTWTFDERHRAARDALRRELGWLGYGSLGTSSYCCPWDRGAPMAAALAKHGVHGAVDTFTASYDGDDAALAARAYDLPSLRRLHEAFIDRFAPWRSDPGAAPDVAVLARRVELVHEWRRTLFLDPGLPAELVPADWRGGEARALFHELYAQLEAPGTAAWVTLSLAAAPEGTLDADRRPMAHEVRARRMDV